MPASVNGYHRCALLAVLHNTRATRGFVPCGGMTAMPLARPPIIQLNIFRYHIVMIAYSRRGLEQRWHPVKSGFFKARAKFAAILPPLRGPCLKASITVSFEFRRNALKEHKFEIGQTVYFTSRPIGHMAANSTYQVVRLLPSDGADYQYRIKNANEAFERVARKSQLEFTR